MITPSQRQEKDIAKYLGGKIRPNSGGTRFDKGDITTELFLIEVKTRNKPQATINVKHEWLLKAHEQSIGQAKPYSAIAIRFDPDGEDYFIINRILMQQLLFYLERGEED